MKTLNGIISERLQKKIAQGASDAETAIKMMNEDAANSKDFFLKLGQGMTSKFHANGHVNLKTPLGDFMLHNNAINQAAEKYKIGTRFVKTLSEGKEQWKRDLLAYNLNQFSKNSLRERFLLRSVKDEIRGFLTDKYKILDSFEILSVFLSEALTKGAIFVGGHNSGLNLWIELIIPELIQVETVNNGTIDLIFGARAKTSDYGCGKLMFSIFYQNTICLNGMVGETILEERHIGEKLPEGYNFSKKVHAAASKKTELIIKEMTKTMFSEERIYNQILNIKSSSKLEIDTKRYIERLRSENKLLKGEGDETEMIMLSNRKEFGVEGSATLWKLTQAISAMAREKEPVRQRELMELAGSMITPANIKLF